MTPPTNERLKQVLAEMLPDVIISDIYKLEQLWKTDHYRPVLDTELLHLCFQMEYEFIYAYGEKQSEYFIALRDEVYCTKHSGISIELAMLHASWQQRIVALAKVKGVTI